MRREAFADAHGVFDVGFEQARLVAKIVLQHVHHFAVEIRLCLYPCEEHTGNLEVGIKAGPAHAVNVGERERQGLQADRVSLHRQNNMVRRDQCGPYQVIVCRRGVDQDDVVPCRDWGEERFQHQLALCRMQKLILHRAQTDTRRDQIRADRRLDNGLI